MINRIFWVLLAATLLHACTKPGSVGTDFIGDEVIDLQEVDTVSFETRTVNPGPLVIYDSMPSLTRYLAGNLDDPIFGQSSSQIFAQMRMLNPGGTTFENATLDSVVLSLVYDSTNVYGNYRSEAIDIEVFRLSEDMQLNAEYKTDQTFMTASTPIGQKLDFIPKINEGNVIYVEPVPGDIDTQLVAPQARIRLDDAIGEEIMSYDSTALEDSDNFVDLFKGLNVRVNSEKSMISFNFTSSNLTLYYKENDTSSRVFNLSITTNSPIIPSYSHDYSNATVEDFISNEAGGDSLLFTQGMAGVEFEVDFPYLNTLQNQLVNYAELTFTAAKLPDDNFATFPPVEQLTGVYQNETGENSLIIDAFLAEINNNNRIFLEEAVGGFVQEENVNGVILRHYKLIITNHFSRMLEGDLPSTIRIRPRLKNVKADRVVVYGPGHSEYPMRFKLLVSSQ